MMRGGLSGDPQGSMYHPAFDADVRYTTQELSDDPDTQVAQTCSLMAQYVREDAHSPEIFTDCVSASNAADPATVAADCWAFVRSRIRFVNDDVTAGPFAGMFKHPIVETLCRPRDMSTRQGQRTGDCDDFSMYLAALLTANKIPCKFCTVAADSADPSRYSHVYVVAYPNGQRLPLDASHGQYPGWEVENKYGKRCEWNITYGFPWEVLAAVAVLIMVAFK